LSVVELFPEKGIWLDLVAPKEQGQAQNNFVSLHRFSKLFDKT
jgi:hypothetical protein